MKLEGKLIEKFDEKQVSGSFKKREFVLEFAENPQYPQNVIFQFTQEKCELIDKYQKGQQVEVQFSIQGRSWTAPDGEVKYFNTLQAFAIRPIGAAPAAQAAPTVKPENEDNLPF